MSCKPKAGLTLFTENRPEPIPKPTKRRISGGHKDSIDFSPLPIIPPSPARVPPGGRSSLKDTIQQTPVKESKRVAAIPESPISSIFSPPAEKISQRRKFSVVDNIKPAITQDSKQSFVDTPRRATANKITDSSVMSETAAVEPHKPSLKITQTPGGKMSHSEGIFAKTPLKDQSKNKTAGGNSSWSMTPEPAAYKDQSHAMTPGGKASVSLRQDLPASPPVFRDPSSVMPVGGKSTFQSIFEEASAEPSVLKPMVAIKQTPGGNQQFTIGVSEMQLVKKRPMNGAVQTPGGKSTINLKQPAEGESQPVVPVKRLKSRVKPQKENTNTAKATT